MKDKNGIPLEVGDLVIEPRGGGCWDGKQFSLLNLWEVPKEKDGRGNQYTYEGKKTYFYWASSCKAYKLEEAKLPDGFVFAFKHGLDSIQIEQKFMASDIYTAIKNSNWKNKALTPETVISLETISKVEINSFTDIAEKWDEIFHIDRVPPSIVHQIMKLVNYKNAIPVNGEIGIAAWHDHCAFMDIYQALSSWKKEGVLLEKCKKCDEERQNGR